MKRVSILSILFALGAIASYGTTNIPIINIDSDHHHSDHQFWEHNQHHHGCNCHEAQEVLMKHQYEVQQCNYGNYHACHEAQEDQMDGKIHRAMQCMQMCQGGYRY